MSSLVKINHTYLSFFFRSSMSIHVFEAWCMVFLHVDVDWRCCFFWYLHLAQICNLPIIRFCPIWVHSSSFQSPPSLFMNFLLPHDLLSWSTWFFIFRIKIHKYLKYLAEIYGHWLIVVLCMGSMESRTTLGDRFYISIPNQYPRSWTKNIVSDKTSDQLHFWGHPHSP